MTITFDTLTITPKEAEAIIKIIEECDSFVAHLEERKHSDLYARLRTAGFNPWPQFEKGDGFVNTDILHLVEGSLHDRIMKRYDLATSTDVPFDAPLFPSPVIPFGTPPVFYIYKKDLSLWEGLK